MQGFEPTTFRTRVVSHNHLTRAPAPIIFMFVASSGCNYPSIYVIRQQHQMKRTQSNFPSNLLNSNAIAWAYFVNLLIGCRAVWPDWATFNSNIWLYCCRVSSLLYSLKQSDPMARLFVQYLAVRNSENTPIAFKFAKVGSKFCPNTLPKTY